MARSMSASPQSNDIAAINLERLLSRLEHKILSPQADRRLRISYFERTKTSANVEHARTLLLRLEHSSSSIKIQSHRQAAQDDLLQKRDLIKRLNERLRELDQLNEDAEPDPDSSSYEDILNEGNASTITSPITEAHPQTLDQRKSSSPPPAPSQSILRNRPSPSSPGLTSSSTTAHTETLLTHNRTEQEDLSASLLSLAAALKSNTKSFATQLESEKEVLDRAGEGLERNRGGMQAAEKRMGALRRMSEGKGWYGRLLMYAWIGALWVAALVIVFVLPKLRF